MGQTANLNARLRAVLVAAYHCGLQSHQRDAMSESGVPPCSGKCSHLSERVAVTGTIILDFARRVARFEAVNLAPSLPPHPPHHYSSAGALLEHRDDREPEMRKATVIQAPARVL